MMEPRAGEEIYGGEGAVAGPRAGESDDALDAAELERVREEMDGLLAAHLEREDAREHQEKLEGRAPDPHRTFTGIKEMLDFNKKVEAHNAELASARERLAEADKEYARAAERCAFVPERSSVYHAFSGAVFLVRREPPPVSYSNRPTGAEGTEEAAASGAAEAVSFAIVFHKNEERAGAGQTEPTSALQAQRRTPVGERMAGERSGRGAARRRGRREGPGR